METSSGFPVGNPEQLNAAPWLKGLLAYCGRFFFFPLIEELLCFGQEALSSVTPPWPFFMPYWPRCSQQAPISALERPLVHSAMFEDVVPLLSNDTGYCVAAVCLSWKCVRVSQSCIACLLFGCHSWKACVFQVCLLHLFWLLARMSVYCTIFNYILLSMFVISTLTALYHG